MLLEEQGYNVMVHVSTSPSSWARCRSRIPFVPSFFDRAEVEVRGAVDRHQSIDCWAV